MSALFRLSTQRAGRPFGLGGGLVLALFGTVACASSVPAQGPAPSAPAGPATQQVAPGDRPGVAVWSFDNGGSYGQDAEDFEALRVGLQQILITELGQNSALRIVERSQIREIQDEIAREGVDARTAAQAGRLVGARYMVLGSFVDLFGDFRMDVRVVDVETSEILPGSTRSVEGDREDIYRLVVEIAQEIASAADLPALPDDVVGQRSAREIPDEAVTLFSRAQVYADRGRTDAAREVYQQILDEFPQMTEAREALQQLPG